MNTCLECLPCLGRNAVDAAKRSTDDEATRRCILAEAFQLLSENDYSNPPPYAARKILDIALAHTGKAAIFDVEKKKSNRLAEQIVAELPNIAEYNPDEFESRLRLAVAGNILDFGVYSDLDMKLALNVVKTAFTKPLDTEAVKRVQRKMDSAKRILYILDNCGEAIFDRLFMEPYKDKITLGVRGRQAFNDVVAEDLADCGLSDWKFVSNGPSGIPGTMLAETDDAFRKVFSESDLIIAKGQGNFETMNDYREPIAFLFLAKCPVVTRLIQAETNSIQVRTINF